MTTAVAARERDRVVEVLGRGWSMEQVLREYDHLTPEDIQACLAYAGEVHKSERVYGQT
jgi:uncharacterized protein (DUF433 family)